MVMPFLVRHQFVRFLLVGALNTTFSYLAYACLLRVGAPYPFASFGALSLGMLFSFRTQGALVFGNRDVRLIVRFAACWTAIYVVNVLSIGTMIHLGLDAYVSGVLAIVPTTILSYLAQRYLVFNTAPAISAADSKDAA